MSEIPGNSELHGVLLELYPKVFGTRELPDYSLYQAGGIGRVAIEGVTFEMSLGRSRAMLAVTVAQFLHESDRPAYEARRPCQPYECEEYFSWAIGYSLAPPGDIPYYRDDHGHENDLVSPEADFLLRKVVGDVADEWQIYSTRELMNRGLYSHLAL